MKHRSFLGLAGVLAANIFFLVPQVLAQTVSIGTNPQGSLFYATGTAISGVVGEKTDKQYRVAPYGGSSTYLPLVDRGELEFGLTNAGEATFAYRGSEIFEGRPNQNLRQVAGLFTATNGWMVRADSDMTQVTDLAGKRVSAEFTAGRTFHYIAGGALAASGMTWDDVSGVPVPGFVAGVEMLIDGRVDAAYSTVGIAIAQRAQASIDGGIRFLSIDPKGAVNQRIQSVIPAAVMTTMTPGEASNGIVADPTYLVQTQFVLLASADTDEDVVYELTKTLYENQAGLASALGAFNRFDPQNMKPESEVPYHEGALRFYREIGLVE